MKVFYASIKYILNYFFFGDMSGYQVYRFERMK